MAYRITDETPYTDPNSRGTGSIVTERKGYILRTRGEHNRMVRHDYVCPVHGVFEASVSSGDVPDEMPCNEYSWSIAVFPDEYMDRETAESAVRQLGIGLDEVRMETQRCAETSPWRHPTVNQGLSAGSVKS